MEIWKILWKIVILVTRRVTYDESGLEKGKIICNFISGTILLYDNIMIGIDNLNTS